MKYDQVITLAVNENNATSAVKWGNLWRFVLEHKNAGGGEIGLPYNNKAAILNDAYNFILKESGGNFKESDLLDVVPKQTIVRITQDQKVAINTAIRLLGNSSSDHAEQAYYHLKQLAKNL